METAQGGGCVIGVGTFLLAALCAIVFLAILGPTIGNVFSNVIEGLQTPMP